MHTPPPWCPVRVPSRTYATPRAASDRCPASSRSAAQPTRPVSRTAFRSCSSRRSPWTSFAAVCRCVPWRCRCVFVVPRLTHRPINSSLRWTCAASAPTSSSAARSPMLRIGTCVCMCACCLQTDLPADSVRLCVELLSYCAAHSLSAADKVCVARDSNGDGVGVCCMVW